MAQVVEHSTLDFDSGHDPQPTMGSTPNMETAWDSLSLPLSFSPIHVLSL